jgi:hypothetical protein
MTGYQVTNPNVFGVSNSEYVIVSNLSALNATFNFPDITSVINTDANVTYTAQQLLGNFIIRKTSNSSAYTDQLDTATNIISAMKLKLSGISAVSSFVNGTSFNCKLLNQSNSVITLQAANNVYINGANGSVDIRPQTVANLQLIVGGQTALSTPSNPQTDSIYVSFAGVCCSCENVQVAPLSISDPQVASPPYLGTYNYYVDVNWPAFTGATSYTYATDYSAPYLFVAAPPGFTGLRMYYNDTSIYFFTITVTGVNSCGDSANSSGQANPCFLAGSLVRLADGSDVPIENVKIGDKVVGAFGEINTVLALHRPKLGNARMLKINNEHSTSSHHPHVSADKQFYACDIATVTQGTYNKVHQVITDAGTEEWLLSGLNAHRINELHLGVMLKTIEGQKEVAALELFNLDPDTQLYNLAVSGSHTYHVDGYAVTGWPNEHDFDYDLWVSK